MDWSRINSWSVDPSIGGYVVVDGVSIDVSPGGPDWTASGGSADQRAIALDLVNNWLM